MEAGQIINGKKVHKKYDLFISHSSKDKMEYVDELHMSLRQLRIPIFYDTEVIQWGNNWKKDIIEGTKTSEFAIIVISKNFFDREWTEKELTDFLKRENESGQKIILPLLYKVTEDEMKEKYPKLGDIQYISSEQYSIEQITILFARELLQRYRELYNL
jgi:hypothetical protein